MPSPIHTQLLNCSDDHLGEVTDGLIRVHNVTYRCRPYAFVDLFPLEGIAKFYDHNNNLALTKHISFSFFDPPRPKTYFDDISQLQQQSDEESL